MEQTEKLAETIMRRYPRAGLYPYKNWSYSQGFMLWGFILLYKTAGNAKYRDYVLEFCDSHVEESGTIPAFSGGDMDDMFNGSVLVWAHEQTGNKKYEKACHHIRAAFDDYPRTKEGGFWHSRKLPHQMWVDGVFMGQMFFSKYARHFSGADIRETINQLQIIYHYCNKNSTGLILHAYSDDRMAPWADPVTGLSPEVWSEGLGWYALMLPHALEAMDKNIVGYDSIVRQYRELAESLKAAQNKETGLWYQVVDKGENGDNWTDTSGSAMFQYSILRALQMGIVKGTEYEELVQRGHEGILTRIHENSDGLLDITGACDGLCVQKSYSDYVHYPRQINAKEAVAAVLWALEEYDNYVMTN